MRTALTPIALLIAACSVAQPFERVEVVKVDSTRSAADLYRTSERWFVDTFKDAQEVIQLRDTTTHTLVGKGARSMGEGAVLSFSLEVMTKAGRFRLRIYDVSLTSVGLVQSLAYYGEPDTNCFRIVDAPLPDVYTPVMIEQMLTMRKETCDRIRGILRNLESSLKAAMDKPKEDW